jgi:transaldolase
MEHRRILALLLRSIAYTRINPVPIMRKSAEILKRFLNAELLWANPRGVLECGCHIITATPDIIAKLSLFGQNLKQYSLETVKMFYEDASAAFIKLD